MNRIAAGLLALVAAAPAAAKEIQVTVAGGTQDRANVVVVAPLPKDSAAAPGAAYVTTPDGKSLPAQVTAARLLAPEGDLPELVFVLPALKAGQPVTVTYGGPAKGPHFEWKQNSEGLEELDYDGRPVLEYFHKPFDVKVAKDTTHNPTIKPFHHLYDATGKVLLTNGVDGTVFPHHRGIFFGFNKCSYDGKSADVWHGKPPGSHQSADKVLAAEAGPILGRHRVAIGWHGPDGKVFADEERELTVYHVPGGTLVEFATIVRPAVENVKLDGDPQHAGFHFRANDEVAQEAEAAKKQKKTPQTYYLRPDGKGRLGDTRNWDPKTKQGPVNLPWDALSFVLQGKRYTVAYLDRAENPKEARFSEREYGRFGSYFEYDLTKDKPLRLNYRLWAQEGEMTVEQCQALSRAFVEPPLVTVAVK
jgi:Family of unknown function (DUF6807)